MIKGKVGRIYTIVHVLSHDMVEIINQLGLPQLKILNFQVKLILSQQLWGEMLWQFTPLPRPVAASESLTAWALGPRISILFGGFDKHFLCSPYTDK